LTEVIALGGIRYGKDYGEWCMVKGWRKNVLLEESPDIKRAQNEKSGYSLGELVLSLNEMGYGIRDGKNCWIKG
jgi:hypothetical protein